jgi:choline dehydrogenase-like flavoprotein
MSAEDVPAGFLDARTLRDGQELTCDVCVIGSGAAGTTAALQLRRRGRSVLLIESGGGRSDPATDSLCEVDTSALPIGPEARRRTLGGTTSVWWGGSALLEEIDFTPRSWLGVPGWPIARSELMPYYARACRLLGTPDLTRVTLDRFRSRRGLLVRVPDLETVVLFWPRKPRRFRGLLEPAVRTDPGLEAVLYANVTGITPTAGGGAVQGLEARTVTGRTLSVRPNVVVLACGGIENARLLLASGGPGGVGLGNDRDVVGRFYMDHPKGDVGIVDVSADADLLLHPGYWDGRVGRFRLGIRLSDERQRSEQLLNGYIRFEAQLAAEGLGIEALRELRRRGAPALRSAQVVRGLTRGLPDIARYARFKVLNRGRVRAARITNFTEQTPRRENRVSLSDRVDRFGSPLPTLAWSIAEPERRSMRRLHALLDEDVRRRGFGAVRSPLLDGDDDPWEISRDASHHMGTTRMGDDRASSVVDRDCRVHGFSNLYVAGSSVFATTGYANPTLTIVALAERLGDHLGEARSPLVA